MYEVRINLGNAASLAPLAAPVVGAGALPGGMPGAPGGIYLILNTGTNTRYAGISTNTQTRFNGRMAVINELGMAAAHIANIWAWWGRVSVRRFPPPANFVAAFPTTLAGLPLAARYALPGGAAAVCPAPMPAVVPAAPAPMAVAQDAVALPVRVAVAAYRSWVASAPPPPRTAGTFAAAWPGGGAWPAGGPPALPGGAAGAVAAAASGAATAQLAAQAAAAAAGAPAPIAALAAAAVHAYATGAGLPPASDAAAVVAAHYGGAPLAAPPPPTVNVVHNPAAGPPTALTFAVPGAGALDLEHVFIRFVLLHLGGGGFVTNGAKIGPLAWPGGAEPICVTWNSCAGGGGVFGAFARSVLWWPGTFF